jgi:hypothetical protein
MEIVEPEVKLFLFVVLPLDWRRRIAEKLIDDLVAVSHGMPHVKEERITNTE